MIASRTGRDNQRFDQDGVQLKAGCVAVLDGQVVLISSSKNKSKWGLPKGGWELDETAEEAAIRETYEEAGVRGVIGDEVLTNESVSKSGELVKAKWFMLDATELLDQWPEASSRVRALYDIDAAIDICCRAEQKDVLIQAKARGLKVFATSAAAREATPLDA
mmetsp:Transcript_14527/g.42902  ORF Transcript_14527/g.42902 Transcript_14527/m.42902 type:complete len:163 (-) Transcript_14527:503-991(-)|eukprot:CAMPEP_0118972106 /NCGR_PEP_ID=MMETSP1173-20130426/8526_1 /TAXON_ID=1034831 /ORGANISM="Rhizochromulina marina cf, Strain CCMP1243" /LENGTH=162 /DNA_ID=CAMNT_0006921623 /DNA_START=224 /DNA_END=712 /DNA_ORIENTATION=-